MADVTQILKAIEQGEPHAAEKLLPIVYDELRRLAAQKLAHEQPGQTLQATALVHEAYMRLAPNSGRASGSAQPQWDSRGHFFAAAAEAMRRILVENARRKNREIHGGGMKRVELGDDDAAVPATDERLLSLDDALTKLAGIRPQAAQIVQLRFFAGLGIDEAARIVGVSDRTARRLWVFARAWLRTEMDGQAERRE